MKGLEQFLWLAVWPAIAMICFVMLTGPGHGAVIECNVSPGKDGSYWLWRQIDGRQCWFRAQRGQHRGQDQPKESLRWRLSPPTVPPQSSVPPLPPLLPLDEELPPWELLPRFQGHPVGWDHKE